MILIAARGERSSARRARRCTTGLAKIKDVPSVIFGKMTFDPVTRRVAGAKSSGGREGTEIHVWDGSKPSVG